MNDEYGFGRGNGKGRGMGGGMGRGWGRGGGRGCGQGMGQGPGGGGGMGSGRGMGPRSGVLPDGPGRGDVTQRSAALAEQALAMAKGLGALFRGIVGGETPGADSVAPSTRAERLLQIARKPKKGGRLTAVIDREQCTGCGACVASCPEKAIGLYDIATIVATKCTGCGACVEVCPNGAISLSDETRRAAG